MRNYIPSEWQEAVLLTGLLLFPFTKLVAQKPTGWRDPSPHKIDLSPSMETYVWKFSTGEAQVELLFSCPA